MTTNETNQPRMLAKAGGTRSVASLLRSLAGTPAGWQSSRRRGSFLIIVVGTLALLAVLAIIYSSIGNHDIRMTAAVKKQERLETIPEQVKDYLVTIIGESTLGTFYDSKRFVPAANSVPLSRVTFDYPSTNWDARANVQNASTAATVPFTPTGSVSGFLGDYNYTLRKASSMPATWRPSTPWLADTEPTYLGPALGAVDAARIHQFRHDWRKISNIAPDGLFVNLVNLRNNWKASHTDLSVNTNRMYASAQPTGAALLPGPMSLTTDFGATMDRNIPAHLDSRQMWLFRPARPSAGLLPSQAEYDLNLFADADGDGMLDSRWQELKDARIPGEKNFLDIDDRFRVFVAVRIIDASSMINVNTATDQRGIPTAMAPVGLTPADVDLRKTLTLQDARLTGDPVNAAGDGVGYEEINQDFPTGVATNPARDPYNYSAGDHISSFTSGIAAYDALRITLVGGMTPPLGVVLNIPPSTDPTKDLGAFATSLGLQNDRWDFTSQPLYKADHYNWVASGYQGASRDLSATTPTVRLTSAFTVDDMFELNMRRVSNDASITSALELTLGGRNAAQTRFSPLRSNRPLEIERRRYTSFDPAVGSPYDRTMLLFETDVRQRLTTVSGARELRLTSNVDPYQLSKSELRIDPREMMAYLTNPAAPDNLKAAATNAIFEAYTQALAPRLDLGTPWATTQRQTEFYGHRGPEMALRIAAHMAVNFIDCFDTPVASGGNPPPPEQPTVHTLVAHADAAAALDALDISTPEGLSISQWLKGPKFTINSTDYHPLQLMDSNRLAGGTDPVLAPVVNIYGVEAQPFITQVASFTVYGDDQGNSTDETTFHNIKGETSPTNTDFLYRMVAFQIHNPFSTPIKLSNQTEAGLPGGSISASISDDQYYYITFGAKTFKLGKLTEAVDAQGAYPATPADVKIEPITIPAGGTIVVYALTDTPQKILQTRMGNLTSASSGGSGYLNATDGSGLVRKNVQRYIEKALQANLGALNLGTNRGDIDGVYWIPEINATGMLDTPLDEDNLIPPSPGAPGSGAPDVFANLWRTIRVTDVDTAGTDNKTGNDQLVDRVRIPNTTANPYTKFDAHLDAGQHDIEGSDATSNEHIFMLTCWGIVSRPGDPAVGAPPRGALPAYCLEPKFSPDWNNLKSDSWSPSGPLNESDFVASGNSRFEGAADNIESWFEDMSNFAFAEIAKHPDDLGNPPSGVGADAKTRPYAENYIEVPLVGNNLQMTATINGNQVKRTVVRPADLLLPLGVGPEEMPLKVTGGTPSIITDLEQRWTTLGEALSMSLLYQVTPSPAGDVSEIYYPDFSVARDYMFSDRGGLRLDGFAPFIDVDGNFDFNAGDERLGSQAPLALSILDAFTCSPADTGQNGVIYRWDTLKRATPGTVNANTAPVNTLRSSFPTLSPPPNTDPAANPWWWWASGDLNQRSDIAATVVAYRDKNDQYVHAMAKVADPAAAPPPNTAADNQDRLVSFIYNPNTTPPGRPDQADNDDGRRVTNQVLGIHEQPGFRTRGELLAANFIYDPAAALEEGKGWPGNMAFLGHDRNASNQPTPSGMEGVDTVVYRDSSGAVVPPEIPNSYKEQLSVINSVLNSVSTRSDYFVCWFLVHGYQKSDVENLGPNDPMIPSMARRFIMIVDRSKVTRLGDKPEVILFKEVPVDPMPR